MIDIRNIPKERKIVLKLNEKDLFEELKKDIPQLATPVDLIFTDEVTLQLTSKYGNLIQVKGSNLLTLLSGATNGIVPSGQFGIQGLQIWEETDPIEFTLSVELHMKTSGFSDVVVPALALSKICLPSYKSGDSKKGISLIPPGPDLRTVLNLVGSSIGVTELFGSGKEKKSEAEGGGLLTIEIGKYLTIPNVVVTKVEPTFSNILDEDYKPVSCKLSITFRTVEVATTYMISQMIKQIG
ncbi:MAG: hypothetical protein AB7V16_07415 [Vulcanibacillus sp.]